MGYCVSKKVETLRANTERVAVPQISFERLFYLLMMTVLDVLRVTESGSPSHLTICGMLLVSLLSPRITADSNRTSLQIVLRRVGSWLIRSLRRAITPRHTGQM